jgi:hypothetical protein
VKLAAVLALCAGCYTGSTPVPPPLANKAPRPASSSRYMLDQAGLGELRAGSQVSIAALRRMFEGHRVEPEGANSSFVFNVFDGDERLFYVVPTASVAPYGAVFGVHVTSPRIPDRLHGWRVGDVFFDRAAIERCECWGGGNREVATCYRPGEHVAVLFERGAHGLRCAGVADARAESIVGTRIDRLVWQPDPWGR